MVNGEVDLVNFGIVPSREEYESIKDIEIKRQTKFIHTILGGKSRKGQIVADLGCGYGHHAKILSDLGYNIIAADRDPERVEATREKIPSAKVLQADISQIDLGQKVDGIICLGGAVNYLMDEKALKKTIKKCYEQLETRGVVVIDVWYAKNLNGDYEAYQADDLMVAKWNQKNGGSESIFKVLTFVPSKGIIQVNNHRQAFQDPFFLCDIMKKEGFSEQRIFNNFETKRFDPKSKSYRSVVVAYK